MNKEPGKMTRRSVLGAGAGLALGGSIPETSDAAQPRQSVYQSLGLKHVINATGTVTNLGGSIMPPEVAAAWVEASRHFVNLPELQQRVGERIAELIGVEAAFVTTGAAGAILLGTAAVLTRGDLKAVGRLPDVTGLRNEVIMQRTHRSCYDNQILATGAKIVEIETSEELAKAIGSRTALMFFMNKENHVGRIGRDEWLRLARQHQVPAFLDAAADVPPPDRLAGYNRMGFDLVAFSGGKAMRGPNDTGLLLGSKPLIQAASRNSNPNCGTIGRAMKVGKEDLMALLAAVERFVKLDHKAEWQELERRIEAIEGALKDIPTIAFERIVPAIANEVPHLIISWDETRLNVRREQITRILLDGDPPIAIGRVSNTGDRGILVSVLTLQPGEEKIVGQRLRSLLSQ